MFGVFSFYGFTVLVFFMVKGSFRMHDLAGRSNLDPEPPDYLTVPKKAAASHQPTMRLKVKGLGFRVWFRV